MMMIAGKEKKLLYAMVTFAVVLLVVRIGYTKDFIQTYLLWNLFLAGLPYTFSQWSYRHYQNKNGMMLGTLVLWLLFLPNSAYIITDFVHLNDPGAILWFDILLIFSFSLAGLLYGLFSMYIVHSLVAQFFTARVSWLMIFVFNALSGLGIYVGRFLRWNSWEVFTKPFYLLHEFIAVLNDPYQLRHMLLFSALFAAFLVFTYGLLYFVKGPVVVNEKISFSAYFDAVFKNRLLKKVFTRN